MVSSVSTAVHVRLRGLYGRRALQADDTHRYVQEVTGLHDRGKHRVQLSELGETGEVRVADVDSGLSVPGVPDGTGVQVPKSGGGREHEQLPPVQLAEQVLLLVCTEQCVRGTPGGLCEWQRGSNGQRVCRAPCDMHAWRASGGAVCRATHRSGSVCTRRADPLAACWSSACPTVRRPAARSACPTRRP